jgi:prepilin-type N-terminal cleavage/methylation domain-containing protein
MKESKEEGFSLVELLCVVVIIGIIAAIAIPALRKGVHAAENGATFGALRTIASTEISFFSVNERFGRLDELNSQMNGALGASVGANQIVKNGFVYEMLPGSPTDAELHQAYTVTATRAVTTDTTIYKWELTQTGEIVQILP